MQTDTATTLPLIIDLPDMLNSAAGERDRNSWHHRLVLKPSELTVEVWSLFGSGTPEALWHDRVIGLGAIPDGVADLSPIRAVLESREDDLRALAAMHSVVWDGRNNVGTYTDADRANDLAQDLSDALDAAGEDCTRFWDASDWLASVDDRDLFGAAFDGSPASVENRAAELVAQATPDAMLDQDNVESYLARRWADAVADAAEAAESDD